MTKIIALMLSITLLSTTPVEANQAVDLNKNDPAPFSGVLMDKEKSNDIKNELLEKDGLKKLNESYAKSIDLYKKNEDILNQKSTLLLDQNINLTKVLNDTRSTSTWEKVGLVFLGVVVTGAAVWGASKLR